MKNFNPKLSILCMILSFGLLSLGGAVFIVFMLTSRHYQSDAWIIYPLSIIFAVICLSVGIYLLYGSIILTAKYEIDNEGIKQRVFWGDKRIEWRNLARFEINGGSSGSYSLWDHNGIRIRIETSVLVEGSEALSEIQTKTALLQAAMLREWRQSGVKLSINMPFGVAGQISILSMAALFFVMLYFGLRLPMHKATDVITLILGFILFGGFGLVCLWAFLQSCNKFLLISNTGIGIHSLGFHREIAYSEIESVLMRDLQSENSAIRMTTIRSRDNRKLMINVHYANYPLFVEFLQQRTGESAIAAGAEEASLTAKKHARIHAKVLLYILPLLMLILLGPAIWMMHAGNQRIDLYHKIHSQGIPVTATITSKSTSGSESAEYLLHYSIPIPATGKSALTSEHASPVDYDDWKKVTPGQKMPALYLPEDPESAHLMISISNKLGEYQIRTSYFYLGIGIMGVCYFGYMIFKTQRTQAGKWEEPVIPSTIIQLDSARLEVMRRELWKISFARVLGIRMAGAGIAGFLIMGLALLLLSLVIPPLKDYVNSRHHSIWEYWLVAIPVCAALSAWLVIIPFGEIYAFFRLKHIENDLADPRLINELIRYLRRSRTVEQNLSGSTSVRALNALTAILRDPAWQNIEIIPKLRSFLSSLLDKWQNEEKRTDFCVALLQAIPSWNDAAAVSAVRAMSRTSSLPVLRQSAEQCLALCKSD